MQMHVNVWTEQTNRQKEKRTSRHTNKLKFINQQAKVASLAISHVLGSDCHEQVGHETSLGFPTK